MRFLLLVLLMCPIGLVGGCGTKGNQATSSSRNSVVVDASWKKFSHQEGRFSLLMPGIPTETVSTIDTVVGPVEDHAFLLKAVQGKYKAGYLISYTDYPREKRSALSDDQFLETTFQSIQEANQDRMLYKKKVKIGTHEGIEYQYSGDLQPGHLITGRNYVVGNRLIMVTAIMPEEQFQRGDAMKYLDSFELTR